MASNGSKPEFDFSRVTKKWKSVWRRTNAEIDQWNLVLNEEPRDDLTPAEQKEIVSAKANAMLEIDNLVTERDKLIAKILKSVPREWLDSDAPTDLDWSDHESLGWLLGDKEIPLLEAMGEAQAEDSKN